MKGADLFYRKAKSLASKIQSSCGIRFRRWLSGVGKQLSIILRRHLGFVAS
jgi:hypothetical protein